MKIKRFQLGGRTYTDVRLGFGQYENGRTAIQLFVTEGPWEELLATATVNLVHSEPSPGCVFIKDYSENEGMLIELIKLGIVRPTGRYVQSGYVHIPEAELLVPIE